MKTKTTETIVMDKDVENDSKYDRQSSGTRI